MTVRLRLRTIVRRWKCRIGWHRWQYLMAPPAWKIRDKYESGIWCIFCGAKCPHRPGGIYD